MKTLSTSTQNSPFGGFRGLLALLLFLLWAIGGFAQGSVSNMATDYTANKVSFTLTWTTQPHDNRIWVIVDYIKVENASTAGNTWKRAPVMAVARNAGAGSVATAIGQRGFWLNTSGSSGSANVTATLNPDTDIQLYNWCAYVLNYPPEAKIKPEGGYNLNGTPPFTINGALNINSETFGAGTCITSITDATGNPAGIIPPAPAATVTSPTICYNTTATLSATVGGGTTTAMTYTWNINGATSVTTAPTITTTQSLTTATTYTVTLRNANGCTSAVSDIGTITVRTNFTPNSIATTGQTICSGGAVTTIGNATAASGGDGAISYQWYRNGSAITGATATTYAPTAYASTVGAQTFTRHAKDGTCNTTLTASTGQWVLTVLADPTVTITAAQTIC
ncbi:MAG: hypothetical protein LBU42_03415, partial [Prevotellaceae bacterium]|nr:hypothetical protein [Prevotellaceae bacterium]